MVGFPDKIKFSPNEPEHVYVFAAFMRPGKHKYSVLMGKPGRRLEMTAPETFCVSPFRGHLKLSFKEYKKEDVARNFEKDKSVFKDWKEDNLAKLQKGFELEMSYSRVPKFVKDPTVQQEIFSLLQANRSMLKTVFLMLCSSSSYPSLSWLDF